MKKSLLTLSLITVTALFASAQDLTVTGNNTANVSAAISSLVNAAATGAPTLGTFSTDAHMMTGITSSAVSFVVKSNRNWNVSSGITGIGVTALGSGGTGAGVAAPLKPEHISWGVGADADAAGSWNVFDNTTASTSAAYVIRSGGLTNSTTFNLTYKVIPTYLVDPGTYVVAIVHTISVQ